MLIYHGRYTNKKKVRRIAGVILILSLEKRPEDLAPRVVISLYLTQIDDQLIYECEVVLDKNATLVRELMVQLTCLCRILRTNSLSSITPLYLETGITPIRYRRAELALCFIYYLPEPKPPIPYRALVETQRLACDNVLLAD